VVGADCRVAALSKVCVSIAIIFEQNRSYDGEVAVEDYDIIRLKATSFSSFSCKEKRNVLDVGRATPDLIF